MLTNRTVVIFHRTKNKIHLCTAIALAWYSPCGMAAPPGPNTLPHGGQVIAGQAAISQQAARMDINQQSAKAIINWQGFDIGSNAQVNFTQPSSSSIALNRVIAGDASQIHGRLTANGQVWLINPNGVVFGKNSRVNVGGLVASTLDISDQDFLSGKNSFQRNGSKGRIINKGKISAKTGGSVVLLAPEVINEGIISAQMGTVALAAGERVTLDAGAGGHLKIAVEPASIDTLVENRQLIKADGGQVIMTAKANTNTRSSIVANKGRIEANTMANKNGRILLLGDMQQGKVKAAGKLKAKFVETSAAKVELDKNLQVDTQGGQWLIDPTDITIDADKASAIETALTTGNVTVTTVDSGDNTSWGNGTNPGAGTDPGDIHVNAPISWSSNTLTLEADNDININATLTASGTSELELKYGFDLNVNKDTNGSFKGSIDFPGRSGTGFLTINGDAYTVIGGPDNAQALLDLQAINTDDTSRAGLYALGANIDAAATLGWNAGAGFEPIGFPDPFLNPFTGKLDGLGHRIENLHINRSTTEAIGFIGLIDNSAEVWNLGLENASINGGDYSGILAAGNLGVISNSYVSGTISGNDYVGGLVGENYGSILNSHAIVNISGDDYVGGLAGSNAGGSIDSSYAWGNFTANNYIDALAGENTGSITNSHYNIESTSINGRHLVTESGLYNRQFNDWLAYGESYLDIGNYSDSLIPDGSSYLVSTMQGLKDLLPFANDGLDFLMDRDIALVPDFYIPSFTGTFDGQGHVVSGIDINMPETDNIGFIGELQPGSEIMNLGIKGGYIIGHDSVGALIGSSFGNISNSYSSASVQGNGNIGGLVGFNSGDIMDSYANGPVTGNDRIGGLVGSNLNRINRTYASGEVTGAGQYLGGLVGHNEDGGIIKDSYWDIATSGQPTSAGSLSDDYAGKDTAEMKQEVTFVNWNFNDPWRIYEDASYPILRIFQKDITITANDDAKVYDGIAYSGGNGAAYEISHNTSSWPTTDISAIPLGPLTYSGSSQGAKDTGSYIITPNQAFDRSTQQSFQDWGDISLVDGTLTITAAPPPQPPPPPVPPAPLPPVPPVPNPLWVTAWCSKPLPITIMSGCWPLGCPYPVKDETVATDDADAPLQQQRANSRLRKTLKGSSGTRITASNESATQVRGHLQMADDFIQIRGRRY